VSDSIAIVSPNGAPFAGVSSCTLIRPTSADLAITPSKATPPTWDAATRKRRMTFDFHGACVTMMGCTDCGCHARVTFDLPFSVQEVTPASRTQNIPCKGVGPRFPGASSDANAILFSITVEGVIDPRRNHEIEVTYCSGAGPEAHDCLSIVATFWRAAP
jgi:hypothetical protein